MLRFLLVAILLMLIARAFWRVVDGIVEAAGGSRKPRPNNRQTQAMKLVRDPVCGTYVPPATALMSRAHGTPQYFCSERCRDEYQSQATETQRHRG